jgi:hypothetical protein
MKDFKHYVLPVQILLLFIIPAIMITLISTTFALVFMVLGDCSFYDVTTSTPMLVIDLILYMGFLISVGNWMWDEA